MNEKKTPREIAKEILEFASRQDLDLAIKVDAEILKHHIEQVLSEQSEYSFPGFKIKS